MGFHQFQSLPQNSGKKTQEGSYGFRIKCHARTSLPIWFSFLLGGDTSIRLDTLVLLRYVSFLPFSLVCFDISVTEL